MCLMAKGNLLIAEDDAVLRNLYVKKFTMEGYDVRTAEDGERTIAMLREQAPDLLICDIHMPKVDGFQVLKEFPKAARKFPVIMLTNFDQDDFKLRAQELGADDYFVKKDMTIRSLVDMVEKLRHL
jgi:DNA-binding response OmpR family regulator